MVEQPSRVSFFEGQLLTAADLAAEQDYHRQMRYLHNRLHGYGVASGLDVAASRGRVTVSPGLAVDGLGRELVLVAPVSLRLERWRETPRWHRDLVISWDEKPACPVVGVDGSVPTRWVEVPVVRLRPRGRARPEELLLARLTSIGASPVTVDVTARRRWGCGLDAT
jgi:hypothetical protein